MRVAALLALALVASACQRTPPPSPPPPPVDPLVARIDAALEKSVAFLVAHQDKDGAFRSTQYAAFKDGRAVSPMVLSALLFLPTSPERSAAYQRGVDFVASIVDATGQVIGPLDYPVYSTAGALLVLSVPRNARHDAKKAPLIAYLRARQLNEANGWTPADVEYGGWGYWPDIPKRPKDGEPRDELLGSTLSSTLFAVGALSLAGVAANDPALIAARSFLARCRAQDGGFFLTPSNPVANKAGAIEGDGFAGYGSATADAARLMLRLRVPQSDPLLAGAKGWLASHVDGAHQSGAFPAAQQFAKDGSRFYSAWTQAHALLQLGQRDIGAPPRPWPAVFAEELMAEQRPDGSFQNTATDLREDDLLVATPLAAAALALARAAHTATPVTMTPP